MVSTVVPPISAIDLFCGAGGLSFGLQQAGVLIAGGFDNDGGCRHPYEANIGASFFESDVRQVNPANLTALWPEDSVRVLAGCAPCQPFSSYRRGKDTSKDERWPLLDAFGALVKSTLPDVVTMENVPRVVNSLVYERFVELLTSADYEVSSKVCFCPEYGLPQRRRRLVLIASRIGRIDVPEGSYAKDQFVTVKDTIQSLPKVGSGEVDPEDPLHRSRSLSELNLQRIRASTPGGSWRDWPESLRAPCHRRATGDSFGSVYARMEWDAPSPTITTQAYNFGTGRFGHPEQDRPITIREAAMLQGFPRTYAFVPDTSKVELSTLCRMIGNAVPPPLGRAVGTAIVEHVTRVHRSAP